MGLFKRRDGLQQEREQDPVQQAKEALRKYLEILDEKTGPDVPEGDRERNMGRERYAFRGSETAEIGMDEIKTTVQEAIGALDRGDIKEAMSFLTIRDANLYNYHGGAEGYLLEAKKALSSYMEAGILNGSINVDDMSIEAVDKPNSIVAFEDLRVPAGTKLPNGQTLEEDANLKVLINGNLAFIKPSGEIFFINYNSSFSIFLRLIDAINRFDRGVDVLEGRKPSFTIPKGTELPGGRILKEDADMYILGSTLGDAWAIREKNEEPELLGLAFSEEEGWRQLWEKYHKV